MVRLHRTEIDLGDNGGRRVFSNGRDLRKFVEAEKAAWTWAWQTPDRHGHHDLIRNAVNNLDAAVRQGLDEGRSVENVAANLPAFFDLKANGLLHSESALGVRIQEIRTQFGDQPAMFAHSFARGWIALSEVGNRLDHFQAALSLASPISPDLLSLDQRLAQERTNYRQDLRRLIAEGELADRNRADAVNLAFTEARHDIRRWAAKRSLRWRKASLAQRIGSDQAIADIRTVQATYEEVLALQAPSTYWRNKAKTHQRSETFAGWTLAAFFVLALSGLGGAFWLTASLLLSAQDDPRQPVYFVVSAGLATLAGLVLWIGRLLTRLYLSEHHLRKDAEERRIMTTTYLALTRKNAVESNDRQVILAALFRNSADGIVKDEGAGDLSLAAFLSRLGMPGAGRG